MKRHRLFCLIALFLSVAIANAQRVVDPSALPCASDSGNVVVTPLYSDSLSSSFLICIPNKVPPHFHKEHTEHVLVLEGEAIMLLGDSTFVINAGSTIAIPKGTPHAVRTTSSVPLRVISVQSPRYDGTDRVPIER